MRRELLSLAFGAGRYPYIAELEKIAIRRGIPIEEPFQGRQIGAFTVLAPSPLRYGQLILSSDRTPQTRTVMGGILSELFNVVEPLMTFIKSGWGSENFSDEKTSVENEMSVVQYANIAGDRIVFTGDGSRWDDRSRRLRAGRWPVPSRSLPLSGAASRRP